MLTELYTAESHPKLFHGRRCPRCGETPRLYWKGNGFLCVCRRPGHWWQYLVEFLDELKRQELMRECWTSEIATLRDNVEKLTDLVMGLRQQRKKK